MAEISVEEKAKNLETKLQESLEQEKSNSKVVLELNEKITNLEKENLAYVELTKALKREFQAEIERLKTRLQERDLDHKLGDTNNRQLASLLVELRTKFEAQTSELLQKSKALAAAERAFESCRKITQNSATRAAELTKEIGVFKNAYDEARKNLLLEKKMSRRSIEERDQQQQTFNVRLAEYQKEVTKQKQIVGTLTSALTQKVSECKSQKDLIRVMKLSCEKQNREISAKMEEIEKKEREWKNKQCEYCGF